jgi:hypothetical protein
MVRTLHPFAVAVLISFASEPDQLTPRSSRRGRGPRPITHARQAQAPGVMLRFRRLPSRTKPLPTSAMVAGSGMGARPASCNVAVPW